MGGGVGAGGESGGGTRETSVLEQQYENKKITIKQKGKPAPLCPRDSVRWNSSRGISQERGRLLGPARMRLPFLLTLWRRGSAS